MLEHCLSMENSLCTNIWSILHHSNSFQQSKSAVHPFVMFLSALQRVNPHHYRRLVWPGKDWCRLYHFFQCTRWKTIYAPKSGTSTGIVASHQDGARKLSSTSVSVFPSLPVGAATYKFPWQLQSLINAVCTIFQDKSQMLAGVTCPVWRRYCSHIVENSERVIRINEICPHLPETRVEHRSNDLQAVNLMSPKT